MSWASWWGCFVRASLHWGVALCCVVLPLVKQSYWTSHNGMGGDESRSGWEVQTARANTRKLLGQTIQTMSIDFAALNALAAATPRPAGMTFAYGTAGFRARAEVLPSTFLRMGMLAALRSIQLGKVRFRHPFVGHCPSSWCCINCVDHWCDDHGVPQPRGGQRREDGGPRWRHAGAGVGKGKIRCEFSRVADCSL